MSKKKSSKQSEPESMAKQPAESTRREPAESTRRETGPACAECGGPMIVQRTETPNRSYPTFMADRGDRAAIIRLRHYKCRQCGRTTKHSTEIPAEI